MYQEDKLSSFWTWTEVITILIILTSFLIRIMFGRLTNPQRGLHGARVLITNEGSELSQTLKKLLEDKFLCKVLLLDTQKMFENQLNPNEFKEKLEPSLQQFGSVDVLIYNDYNTKEDFLTQEEKNVRAFLNVFMVMIPKMHFTGGGHIVNIKSNPSSTHALIECRKDYCELAQNLIKTVPTADPNGSNFCLSIVQMLYPDNFDRFYRADRVIEAIISRKPFTRLTHEMNAVQKVTELARRGLNTLGLSI